MAQTDRDNATTSPPSPPPQLQEAVDAANAAATAAELAQDAAEAAQVIAEAAAADAVNKVPRTSETGSAVMPTGSTAERDVAPELGYTRFNDVTDTLEVYTATGWRQAGGGATGGGADQAFYLNRQTVTQNFTIPSGQNAMSAGPITINDGVTVTVSDGSTWTVV